MKTRTKQIHHNVDEETDFLLRKASDYLKIRLSNFVVMASVEKAREVLKEYDEENM